MDVVRNGGEQRLTYHPNIWNSHDEHTRQKHKVSDSRAITDYADRNRCIIDWDGAKQPMTRMRCSVIVSIIAILEAWLTNSKMRVSGYISGHMLNITFSDMTMEQRLRSQGYDGTIRPFLVAGIPCEVELQVYIIHLGPVNQVKMSYGLEIYLRQSWTDPRLADASRTSMVTLNEATIRRMWLPSLYIYNEIEGSFHYITSLNRFVHVEPNGRVTYSVRLTLMLRCKMNLAKFPLDRQTCIVQFESYSGKIMHVTFVWKEQKPIEIATSGFEVTEFVMQRYHVGNCTTEYSTGTFTCAIAWFHFRRKTCLIFVFAGVLEFCVMIVTQRQMVLVNMAARMKLCQLYANRKVGRRQL
ncbi:Glycine receptor subunit alpha-4 [Lamellibrachia satsuma]|nr:Glycine receptor subunit alpha-4 [Lamellibrachia satsuma]